MASPHSVVVFSQNAIGDERFGSHTIAAMLDLAIAADLPQSHRQVVVVDPFFLYSEIY
jgi:hypothetical protein